MTTCGKRGRRATREAIGAMAVVALLATGCARGADPPAAGADDGPPVAAASSDGSTGTSGTPGTAGPTRPEPTTFEPAPAAWSPCRPIGYDCATVAVPLDHDDPTGPTIDLALSRRAATDPAQRIGSLFVNPGGPGASGVEALPTVVAALDPAVTARFDIVSWDPRGIGASTPVECDEGLDAFWAEDLTVPNPGPGADEAAEAWAELCEERSGDLLAHVGTVDNARDLDLLRQAVGDEGLTFLGLSYGTVLGLLYAEWYGPETRAIVLDGVVDPTLPGNEGSIRQAVAVEAALQRWADWCRGDPECPLTGDPLATYQGVLEQARTDPLTGQVGEETIYLSPTYVAVGTIAATYDESLWYTLAYALERAKELEGASLARLVDAYLRAAEQDANLAVGCLDDATRDTAAMDAEREALSAAAPVVGPYSGNGSRPCRFWPVPPNPVPEEFRAAEAPPLLVWGTTGDNATPYENAVHIAGLLADAHLATLQADRHTALGANDCVRQVTAAYVVDLTVPAEGTTC